MKNFALTGAGGYIAATHMQAIKETGNNLIVALDKHHSVGVLESFFPKAVFLPNLNAFTVVWKNKKAMLLKPIRNSATDLPDCRQKALENNCRKRIYFV